MKNFVEMVMLIIQVAYSVVWMVLLFGTFAVAVALGGVVGVLSWFAEPRIAEKMEDLCSKITLWCGDQTKRKEEV